MDKNLMILEYKESKGQWHYNMVRDPIIHHQGDYLSLGAAK